MNGDSPPELLRAIETVLAPYPPAVLRQQADTLSERYRSRADIERLITDDVEAAAYVAVRMPATFAAIKSALYQLRLRLPDWQPETVLDVGAGTGAGLWAINALWADVRRCDLIDHSPAMVDMGSRLSSDLPTVGTACIEWSLGHIGAHGVERQYQLVIASYVLNEVRATDLSRYVDWLWEHTDDLLVIIEPGTPAGFGTIRAVRDRLIDCGGRIIAPCPHDRACPMSPDDWCHFSVRLERSRIHREVKPGELGYEDEKFSYLVASKAAGESANSRIIRHPVYRRGMVRLELCTENGIETRTLTKRKDRVAYRRARSAAWGDETPTS